MYCAVALSSRARRRRREWDGRSPRRRALRRGTVPVVRYCPRVHAGWRERRRRTAAPETRHRVYGRWMLDGNVATVQDVSLLLSDDVMDKLRLLDFEGKFCTPKDITPFPRTYFALPAGNSRCAVCDHVFLCICDVAPVRQGGGGGGEGAATTSGSLEWCDGWGFEVAHTHTHAHAMLTLGPGRCAGCTWVCAAVCNSSTSSTCSSFL